MIVPMYMNANILSGIESIKEYMPHHTPTLLANILDISLYHAERGSMFDMELLITEVDQVGNVLHFIDKPTLESILLSLVDGLLTVIYSIPEVGNKRLSISNIAGNTMLIDIF